MLGRFVAVVSGKVRINFHERMRNRRRSQGSSGHNGSTTMEMQERVHDESEHPLLLVSWILLCIATTPLSLASPMQRSQLTHPASSILFPKSRTPSNIPLQLSLENFKSFDYRFASVVGSKTNRKMFVYYTILYYTILLLLGPCVYVAFSD